MIKKKKSSSIFSFLSSSWNVSREYFVLKNAFENLSSINSSYNILGVLAHYRSFSKIEGSLWTLNTDASEKGKM